MKYYVLTQYISGYAIQVSNDYTSIVEQILQFFPMRHIYEAYEAHSSGPISHTSTQYIDFADFLYFTGFVYHLFCSF